MPGFRSIIIVLRSNNFGRSDVQERKKNQTFFNKKKKKKKSQRIVSTAVVKPQFVFYVLHHMSRISKPTLGFSLKF